jgi:GT2 family glycosyltransferase
VKASVVVPAYNEGKSIGRLLRGLAQSRIDPADSLEVVVVDDGSTDDTGRVVAEFSPDLDLNYLFLPRTPASGRAAARNAGIQKATGELVVMVDSDQVCGPDLVGEHLRYHRQHEDLVVVGPRHDLAEGLFDDERLAHGFDSSSLPDVLGEDSRLAVLAEFSENFNNLETCWHHMFSCNVSVRRRHLLAAGGFDPGFTGWGLEDSELGYRLRRAGLAFAFNPAAVAYQTGREVTPDMFEQWRRNLTYFVAKHGGAAEVAVQAIICRVFDPADRSVDWLDGVCRMELAARALAGRTAGPTAPQWVEADEGNAARILAGLAQQASTHDLLVIDDTERALLAAPVQYIGTPKDLLYFHRPAPQLRDRLRERYPPNLAAR